ncbi:class I tRNA ligase family protein [Photorhabdus viridis]|uniref:class I tRNA ligase family protein n=1 Tax=Photorhabdus viridis TaxID=3163327 RepID=UPI003306E72D
MTPTGFIITLPPPTPNGGLHVGHISGPFLAGDVFARAARLQGQHSFVTCYSDINQSYVRVTAERQQRDPEALYRYWTDDIIKTLKLYHIDVADYFLPEEEAVTWVRNLFHQLYQRGVLVKKYFPFFYSEKEQIWHDEAGISGYCPVCLAACKCGICEACGNLTNAETIIKPRVTNSGATEVTIRHSEVLVLELERFRQPITQFYQQNKRFRQRYQWLTEDALSKILPDFPVTMPGNWGISMTHADFPGQVINAWPEVMAELLYSYQRAIERDPQLNDVPVPVNFFGFDNSYFYAVVHVAMLSQIDNGRWLPWATMINEFYNLDHAKFSTSNNHLVWASDLAQRCSVDAIRFYAAFNTPGFEKANFNEADMMRVLENSLEKSWLSITAAWNQKVATCVTPLPPLSATWRQIGESARQRILASYTLERFHLRQAAEDLLHLMKFIEMTLSQYHDAESLRGVGWLLQCFSQAAWPLMPQSSEKLFHRLTAIDQMTLNTTDFLHLCDLPSSFFSTCISSKEVKSV